MYRAYTKEWCGISGFSEETAPFFCVCPVHAKVYFNYSVFIGKNKIFFFLG
jgi:hypothetical protein